MPQIKYIEIHPSIDLSDSNWSGRRKADRTESKDIITCAADKDVGSQATFNCIISITAYNGVIVVGTGQCISF